METTFVRKQHAAPGNLGTNQSGLRDYNERVVLTLLRHQSGLSKTDTAGLTGLSAQTVSVIMRKLESEDLLVRGEPIRGRVGQPSIPMRLNPDGAFFLGLKIGRRTAELVLLDFCGGVRTSRQLAYPYPVPEHILAFAIEAINKLEIQFEPHIWQRIAGLGIAIPSQLWNWQDALRTPPNVMDVWKTTDMRAKLSEHYNFPVYLQNDATAACSAELVFGNPVATGDFLYIYIGAFIGGGIALNGRLFSGRTGNAGALGSMPVPSPDGHTRQLIDVASITTLEVALLEVGLDPSPLWDPNTDWSGFDVHLDAWINAAAGGLAHAIVSAASVIDFRYATIDGWLPTSIRAKIVAGIGYHLNTIDSEGLNLPVIREGTIGRLARAQGAASLPLANRYLVGIPSVI